MKQLTPLEKVLAIAKKDGAKTAMEFYQTFSDDEKKQCRRQMETMIDAVSEVGASIAVVMAQVAKTITDWWNAIPAETRDALAEKEKEGNDDH